jgi:hypothetical protein
MGAEVELDHPAARVEQDVHRRVEAGHGRDLVDVGAHRPGERSVVRLRRRDEVAVVRLDRLVRGDAGHDQLAAAAVAPVVRLGLADRDLHVAAGDLLVDPHGRPARRHADVRVGLGVARLVLEQRDAELLHPVEVLAPDLLLDVRFGQREDLAVRGDHARVHAGGLDRVEHGRKELRGRGGPELVVDDHGHAAGALQALREGGPCDRRLERLPRGLGGARQGLGLVRVDRGKKVPVGNLELEFLPVDLRFVVRRADRQRVERLERDPVRGHRLSSSAQIRFGGSKRFRPVISDGRTSEARTS